MSVFMAIYNSFFPFFCLKIELRPGGSEDQERDGDDGDYVDALSHGEMFYITGNLSDLRVMSTGDRSQDRSEDRHVNTKH